MYTLGLGMLRAARAARWRAAIRLAAVIAVAIVPGAEAAHFYPFDHETWNDADALLPEPVCNAKIVGEIRKGDAGRIEIEVKAFVQRAEEVDVARLRNRDGRHLALCLASEGGNITEALLLAARFESWMRVVEDGDRCISACAILFMSGSRRDDVLAPRRAPGRYLHVRGALGFHAPRIEVPADGRPLMPEVVAEAYSRAIRTVLNVVTGVDMAAEYGERADRLELPTRAAGDARSDRIETFMGASSTERTLPTDLLLAFLAVPPGRVFYVTRVAEAISWGIELYGFATPRALSRRMLLRGCITFAYLRCDAARGNRCLLPYDEEVLLARYPDREIFQGAALDRPLEPFEVGHADRVLRLWPPRGRSSRLQVRAFAVEALRAPWTDRSYCQIRAIWLGRTLTSLEIDTFNALSIRSSPTDRPLLAPIDETAARNHAARLEGRPTQGDAQLWLGHRLKPWHMLPLLSRIADLGADSWRDLDVGGNGLGLGFAPGR